MKSTSARIVVSGSAWMGGGVGSVESALYQLFGQAQNEIMIVAYAISSASNTLLDVVVPTLERGVRITMVVNRFHQQHSAVQEQLKQLRQRFPALLIIKSFVPTNDQADLHAKIVVVDRLHALIGSANLSLRGLINNHELGVLLTGVAANDVARVVDRLIAAGATQDVISE